MNDQPISRYDKINLWIRNNKVTASLIIFGTIVIALSTFSDAARNLLDLFDLEKRPDINGAWSADVTYDWPNANYIETFSFEGEGDEIHGTATFLKIKRAIFEGSVNINGLQFISRTREFSGGDEGNSIELIHHYSGVLKDGQIQFTLQTEGGYSTHIPIKFTAKKKSDNTNNN